jgi:hypothetical protein
MNHGWRRMEANRMYYDLMFDDVGSVIYTIEHILRVQWFLKQHNVNYFMTFFVDGVIPDYLKTDPDIKYLYDMIDFSNFLPVSSEAGYLGHGIYYSEHPSSDEHKKFTDNVVYPYLIEKKYI